MGIKQKIRECKAEKDLIISQNVKDACATISTKLNMQDRLDRVNDWCNNHPLTVFIVALLTLILSTAISLRSLFNYQSELSMPMFDSQLFERQAMISSVSLSESSRDVMTMKMREIVEDVQRDISLVDSLMALPSLSHQDSMRVWMATERLNSFNQKFSNDKD